MSEQQELQDKLDSLTNKQKDAYIVDLIKSNNSLQKMLKETLVVIDKIKKELNEKNS